MTAPTGPELLVWREDHNLTQEQAARLLPCPTSTWRSWETGRRNPPAYLARALAHLSQELSIRRARGERPVDMLHPK